MADDDGSRDEVTSGPFRGYDRQERRPLLSLRGTMRDGVFTLTHVDRTTGPEPWSVDCPEFLFPSLRDAAGHELARGRMEKVMMYAYSLPTFLGGTGAGCRSFPTREYYGDVLDVPGSAELAILDDRENVLWSARAPERAPEVHDLRATVVGDTLQLSWKDEVALEACEREILWWSEARPEPRRVAPRNVTDAMQRGDARLELWRLPVGEVFLQVRVQDVFARVDSAPLHVRIPVRPPHVEIGMDFGRYRDRAADLADREERPPRGMPFRMLAKQQEHDDPLPDAAFRWLLDGKEIARGPRVSFDVVPTDAHQLALEVTWPGGEFTVSTDLGLPVAKRNVTRLHEAGPGNPPSASS